MGAHKSSALKSGSLRIRRVAGSNTTRQPMQSSTGDNRSAFRVALNVLCLRHPERSYGENARLAADWITRALEDGVPEGTGAS